MAKRALLIGVSGGGLDVLLGLERLGEALARIGFEQTTLSGKRATRRGILRALDRFVAHAEPGDACLIYYFGHGGRVCFEGALADHEFGYVTCVKELRGVFEGVLDIELSRRFTELEARCGNLTAIFDCCYSGELVRAGELARAGRRELSTPPWLEQALSTKAETRLALDSHPRIVRLCGASPRRTAYALERGGRHIGRLTQALLAMLEAAGDEWRELSWASITPCLREQVISAVGNEGQWVALAGPRDRRLFAREQLALPGFVSTRPRERLDELWLRAGWHQGVSVGDRWAVADVACRGGAVQPIAEGRISAVERNRSVLHLDAELSAAPGSPAYLLARASPLGVELRGDGRATLEAELLRSAWLEAVPGGGGARIELGPDAALLSRVGTDLELRFPRERFGELIALLEDWAAHDAWRTILDVHQGQAEAPPLTWTWFEFSEDGERRELPREGASLEAGARIGLEFHHCAPFEPWFVSVVLVDPLGRLRLLNTRMPEGLELSPRGRCALGVRHGGAPQGFELSWPAQLPLGHARASLLIVMARRPMSLAHIVCEQAQDMDDALALQGLAASALRLTAPELADACAWQVVEFELLSARR